MTTTDSPTVILHPTPKRKLVRQAALYGFVTQHTPDGLVLVAQSPTVKFADGKRSVVVPTWDAAWEEIKRSNFLALIDPRLQTRFVNTLRAEVGNGR